jgi:cysteine desulfurase / selenocysteine lyase
MAVRAPRTLDAERLRADFPIFEQHFHGKPLAYLDSAASAQKPRAVLDAMTEFYETSYANVHRGVYELGERATIALESARGKVRAFVNAPSEREIVFVRNATEGLNLVAYAWGLDNLGPGDLVLVTELEHHSNFVPWQAIAARTGAEFEMIPLDDIGELRLDTLERFEGRNVKVVAAGLVSNSLGTVNDIPRLGEWAHEQGAICVVDAAQAAPHRMIDVQALGADFIAVSGHKLCGPSGIGFVWGRTELLLGMSPFLYGGHMIRHVGDRETTWGELPAKFEAGTSPVAEAVGMGAAIDYLSAIGLEAIEAHEHALAAYALEQLGELPGVTLYGPPVDRRTGIVSFNVGTLAGEPIHPHDVAQVLDQDAIAIRAGHHCTQPLMRKLGVSATNRASFYLYNVPDEVDRLAASIRKAQELFA